MSSVAGLHGPAASERLLLTMMGELAHRGRTVGAYVDEAGQVFLAEGRTATGTGTRPVVEAELGPARSADGSLWAVMSGELYDTAALESALAAAGAPSAAPTQGSTQSPAALALRAFEAWGEEMVHRLNGAFALAVYDRRARRLFLARDRFGIQPLFVARYGADTAFASEAKALLRHPAAERRIDPFAVVETFALWAVQPDRSAFPNISELPAGHYMWVDERGAAEPVAWRRPRFGPRAGTLTGDREELADQLRELLRRSTAARLGTGRPVAVYLSGGLDSSAVTAIATAELGAPPKAFAVAFADPRYDESRYQDVLAERLGVDLTRIEVTDADVAAALPDVVAFSEKPLLRTAPGPLLLLSRVVSDAGYDTVLTGEGADELFGGYGIFQESMVRRFWAKQPASRLRPRLLERLYPYLSKELARGGGLMTEFFKVGMLDLQDPLYSHRPRFRTSARNLRFLSPTTRQAAEGEMDPLARLIARLPEGFGEIGPLGQAQYLEIITFLEGFLLHAQGDRMLAANGVTGRFPFLDDRLADFAEALPERLRLNDLAEKYLLKRAVGPLLPQELATRRKRPYRAPILRAFFGPGAPDYVADALSDESLARLGLFDDRLVGRLVAKARQHAETGLSEADEMAIVGVLSTVLLDRALVSSPELAPPAEAWRVVRDDGEPKA